MKLVNAYELKTMLLEERDKIPLTVPGAVYEMRMPQPNKHGEAVRAGIRIALRCMERCQPVLPGEFRPEGRWEPAAEDWRGQLIGNRCSQCGYEYYGGRFKFCPDCGAKMGWEE